MRLRALSVTVVALAALVALSGCRQPKKLILTKEQRERIAANLLGEAPTLPKQIDADFGGAVTLLGATVEPASVAAGGRVEVTYYWKVHKELSGGWKIFGHLEKGREKRQILDHQAIGELYPVEQWKPGDLIRDVQRVTVDGDFPAGTAELWIGFFDEAAWKNEGRNERLPVASPGKARADRESRVLAGTLVVTKGGKGAAAQAPAPSLKVSRAATAPTIDGAFAEAEWAAAGAPVVIDLRPDGRKAPGPRTTLRALWDDSALYLGFETSDKEIVSQFKGRDATLWKEDVVEIYLDPGQDQKDYLELQIAPTGEIFDAFFTSHRSPEWPEAARAFTIDMKAAVGLDGTLNDDQEDKGWRVEVAIPLASIPGLTEGKPAPNEVWKANFYRLDANPEAGSASQLAWAPAGGDFHNLARAGTLTFVP